MKIIVNPTAGGGRSGRWVEQVQNELNRRGDRAEILATERPGHAAVLAGELAQAGEERVVVMGGDGTISEAAQELMNTPTILGMIPMGTGNDLARSLGVPYNNVEAAIDVLFAGQTRRIDMGIERDRKFVLMAAIGYPADVAEEANRMTRLKGSWAFLASVYKALNRMRPVGVEMVLDGRSRELECTSILIMNAPFCGGGQWMAPEAAMDDGLLDVVVIGPIGRLSLMLNFPKVYRGTHVRHPAFTLHRASAIEIRSAVPLRKMFDGDLYGQVPLGATCLREVLSVTVPVR